MTFATSAAELPGIDRLAEYSGLDFMRAVLSGDLPAPPIAQTLNYDLEEVEDGRVTFTGTPRFAHLNPMGGVHGGWYGTLLDSAMACAVMTKVPRGATYTTLEYKVNVCRALACDTAIRAEGRVDHAGRTTALAHGEIRGLDDGRLYATATTTCLIMPLPER